MGHFIGSHRKVSIIPVMIVVLLTGLASLALAQQPPQQSPTWFIPSSEKGAQDESSFCAAELAKTPSGELYKTRTSEILLPESLPPAICIEFPFAPDQLRYGAGTKGECHNKCCFFRPPSKNIPDPPPNPSWYEANNGCNDDNKAVSKPIILNGENGDESTVCIQNEEGVFTPVAGATMACARGCCLFFAAEN